MWVKSTGVRVVAVMAALASVCEWTWQKPVLAGSPTGSGSGFDAAAAERGRVALTLKGFLKPEWSAGVYRGAARLWDQPSPNPR